MAVPYLIFNEGYSATAGEKWMRPDLASEGIRPARMLASLEPDKPDALGLQARLDENDVPVLLEAQSGHGGTS